MDEMGTSLCWAGTVDVFSKGEGVRTGAGDCNVGPSS